MKPTDEQLSTLHRRAARALILILRHPLAGDATLAAMAGISERTMQAQVRALRRAFDWPPGQVKKRVLTSGVTEADVVRCYQLPDSHAHVDKLDYIMRP
jgi:hypothetical protein